MPHFSVVQIRNKFEIIFEDKNLNIFLSNKKESMNCDESNFGRYENSESSDNNMSIMTNSYEDSDNDYK